MSVRAANLEKDIGCILNLLKNIDLSEFPTTEEIKNFNHQWLVFEENGVILGCVVAKKDRGEIGHIAVDPIFREKGIGSKLVKSATIRLNDANCKEIWAQVRINNEGSIGLFKKNKFTQTKIIRSRKDPKVKLYKFILEESIEKMG